MKHLLKARKALVVALSAIMALALAPLVAQAADEDWDRLGAIEVSHNPNDYVQNFNVLFDGPMQRISFRARDNNVRCDLIRVRFLNGQTQIIDHLRYPEGERRAFDLYGDDRRVANVHFECTPGRNSNRARLVIFGYR